MSTSDPLSAWQQANKVTDSELGRRAGCANTTIRRIKRGEIYPSPELKLAIERATEGAVKFEAWAPFEKLLAIESASAGA